ncbi:MAG TPA: type II secretion system F family protein [Moraxellaceae bacterium]|nr:type II secretion system F family protein [Moraxellaceae bacterium]
MLSTYYLFVVLGVLAVVLLIEGAYLAWQSRRGAKARSIVRRLETLSAGEHAEAIRKNLLKSRALSEAGWLNSLLLAVPRVHALDRLLVQSGLGLSVAQLLGLTLAAFGAGALFLFVIVHLNTTFALIGAIAFGVIPTVYVVNARMKRIDKIDSQLPDALDLIGRALRAGHAFQGAMQMVGSESPEPVASEFRITFDEINFGVPMENALLNLATRVPSTDLRYFVIAVLIHRESGGNLAELLDNLSHLMRERMKLKGTIQVLSAEGKLSAWILVVLPFVMAGLINIVNPGFMSVLYSDPLGKQILGSALVLMLVGILWLWKITRIRV